MPRLPTMRVIGSHAISTRPVFSSLVARAGRSVVVIRLPPLGPIAGEQLVARSSPLRFLVDRLGRDAAQAADEAAVRAAGRGRHPAARWLVHERHELVGEARRRAADADAAHVGAGADAVDPPALGDVALHDGAPAAELHDALGRAVLGGEVTLLVVAAPVAA